jgi:2-hydroxy-4-(methylsulfanyl)butanoate S-methyltransferase
MSNVSSSTHDSSERDAVDAIRDVSAIAYGFMGSQALFAALELGLFTTLSEEPCGLDALATRLKAPSGPLSVLLTTCQALGLVTWDGAIYANSPAAQRFLVRTAPGYVGDYYVRQVSTLIYERLPLVRALLAGQPVEPLDYTHTLAAPHVTEEFIRGQHAGSLGPARLLARTHDFSRSARLLDLGGGSGAFAIEAVTRVPSLSAMVFDLPQVISVTEQIVEEAGLTSRITCIAGDLRTDPWPEGAGVILLSYIVSCYAPDALDVLLARALDYLPAGGQLLVHDFALHPDRSGPRNTALFLFGQLTASAQTHAYTVDDLSAAMRRAGYVDVTAQPFLPDLTFLAQGRKP